LKDKSISTIIPYSIGAPTDAKDNRGKGRKKNENEKKDNFGKTIFNYWQEKKKQGKGWEAGAKMKKIEAGENVGKNGDYQLVEDPRRETKGGA